MAGGQPGIVLEHTILSKSALNLAHKVKSVEVRNIILRRYAHNKRIEKLVAKNQTLPIK